MPPHLSHLLQPLDVGCFGPLKHAYGSKIADLARNAVTHITKSDFLAAFKSAYSKAITKDNICGSFRGAGLIPFNPEAVISRLNVRLCTPGPPPADHAQWHTPRNASDLQLQSTLIQERIRRHQDSSPTSIIESFNRYTRGAEAIAHLAVLVQVQVSRLQKTTETATKRKSQKRRWIQREGMLTVEEGVRLAAPQGNGAKQVKRGPAKRIRAEGDEAPQRHCGRCSRAGHNSRTCREDLVPLVNLE